MAEKTKWSIKKRALLVVCSAALLCMNLVFFSLGWFTFHHHDDVNGITNRAVGDKFELFTEGIQPALPTNRPAGYTLAERLGLLDFGILNGTANRTGKESDTDAFHGQINWLLSDESNFRNVLPQDSEDDENGLRPGAYGKLTFYIEPYLSQLPMTIQCSLQLAPYMEREKRDDNGDVIRENGEILRELLPIPPVDDAGQPVDAFQFVKGHILFFRQCSETRVYSDRITPDAQGMLTFSLDDITEASLTDGRLAVTLYWVWPNTLPELLLEATDENLLNRHSLLPPYSTAAEMDATKNELAAEMAANGDYYFQGAALADEATLLQQMAMGAAYDKSDYIALCSAYNRADQCIGTNVKCVVLALTCTAD